MESLISKSELHGVSLTHRSTWVGTVSLLADPTKRGGIRDLLGGMDCIPVFFLNDVDNGGGEGMGGRRVGGERSNVVDLMYLGFCKQVLWSRFHNVDLLDLAMNGWGQRQRDTNRSDPVRACQLAVEEARERKLSMSTASAAAEWGGMMPTLPWHGKGGGPQRPELKSDWDQRRLDSWRNMYVCVNKTFSHSVAGLVSGGDIVWVRNHHLALLPRMLREARSKRGVAGSSVASVVGAGGGGGGLSSVSYTLMAFERLLTDYPVWQSKVVLLQGCLIPSACRVDKVDTLREVRWLVQSIRNRFGAELIDYEEQVGSVLPIDQRLAI